MGSVKSPDLEIGQLMIIGFDGTEITPRLASMLARLQPAGVILFRPQHQESRADMATAARCQRCVATPLFTCVDLEGGTVDRFRDVLGAAPSAAEYLPPGSQAVSQAWEVIGENCRALGFNLISRPCSIWLLKRRAA